MRHRKYTMRKVILIFCMACVVLALLFQTVLFYRSLRSQIRAESVANHENSLSKMQDDVASFLHNIRTEMLTIYRETDLIESLREAVQGNNAGLKDYYWRSWHFARKRFETDDQLAALYIYDAEDNLVSAYRRNCVDYPRNIYRTDYDSNAEKVSAYVHSEETELLVSGYYNPDSGKNIVRLVLKLHNYDEDRDQIGYLVCDIQSSALTTIMDKYVDLAQVRLWLQPVGDQVVAVTGEGTSGQLELADTLADTIKSAGEEITLEEEYGGNYLICVSQSEYNLEAFALVSQSLLTATQRTLIRTLIIIMAAMLAAVTVLAFLISRWVTRPVEEMKKSIIRIKNGETDLRVQPVGWSEELELLGDEFNDMLDRFQAMAREEYQQKLLMERTEYKMLQAQINPHFLYNTLDTMSGIANAQNCPLVSGLCRSLSAIFRYSLNMTDELSTVQKEMAHVRNYLYVMDVRNGHDVACDYQIESETLQDRLPRLCLQPIVENAVTHGLRNVRRKDKKLLMRSEHRDGKLVITISDNGAGMDSTSMNQQLLKNDIRRVESGVSIGVLNVNARLKRLFGESYGLKFQSEIGAGTTVILTAPAITEEKSVEGTGTQN